MASGYKSRLIPRFHAQVCCLNKIIYWLYRDVIFFVFNSALSYPLIIISASSLHPFVYYILILFFSICLVHHDITFFTFLPAFSLPTLYPSSTCVFRLSFSYSLSSASYFFICFYCISMHSRRVSLSCSSHDTQYPPSSPFFCFLLLGFLS